MESLEFYAQLLYQSKMLGTPQEFTQEQMDKLYTIRRNMGLPGKHPATNDMPTVAAAAKPADADLVASITKKVMEQLGM